MKTPMTTEIPITDNLDDCNFGDMGWISTPATDHDSDGCNDITEDDDDDNDGLRDSDDQCQTGDIGWGSTGSATDYDSDGCQDSGEDLDDDNDGIDDVDDLLCQKGDLGDGSSTGPDNCTRGSLGWTSVSTGGSITDYDTDGCQDLVEDLDDDNDQICDTGGPAAYGDSSGCAISSTGSDKCPANTGDLDWISDQATTDYDSDGCQDSGEDLDDDNDDICDSGGSSSYGDSSSCEPSSTGIDECTANSGRLNWISIPSTDNDGDGCHDDEDIDDDNDGVSDGQDNCQFVPNGPLLGADNQLNYDLIHESVEE